MAPKRNTPVYNSKKRSPSDTVNLGAGHDVENTLFRDIFYESSSPWSFSSDAAVDAEETEYTLANHLINASVDLSESQNRSDETHTQATSQVAAGLSSHGAAHQLKLDKQALSGTVLTPRNLGDSTAAHRHDFQKHHALRTRLPYQHTAHGISSGLLTPNTTPSTGGQRWTPPSAIDSCASGSSGSLFHRQPSLDTSPSEGLNPDTYASDSPWVQSSLIRSLFEPHRCSGIDPGSTGRFGLPTERQLFKSNHGLQYGQVNHQSAIQGRSLGFRPMDALLSTDSQNQNPMFSFHNGHHLNRHQYGPLPSFSSRYCGKHVDSNASADHLLPEQNCALWLTNLPPNITYSQLLGSIRNFGRIWCTYINEPNQREHVTAAAKVVFFSPQAASAFVQAGWSSASPLVIHGYHIKVAYNRIKYPEKSCAQGESRVLIVVGHPSFVNEDALLVFFRARFIFQTDRIRTLWYTPTCAVLEFSFGSYRCQAQMGMMALEKDRPAGFEKVYYGQDPCEVGESQPENEAYPRNHGLFT